MQPFPLSKTLEPLIGDSVVQVRLDPNSVQILFGSGLVLMIEERLHHECNGLPPYRYQCEAWCDGPTLLHRLIQKSVVGLDREDWSLTILLDDGSKITVDSVDSNLESGHFAYPDGRVIVF